MSDLIAAKQELRKRMRRARLEHAQALPPQVSALVFKRPPAPVLEWIADDAVIALYRAGPGEAPTSGFARFFLERGHTIALPRVTDEFSPMTFHAHIDPWEESDLAEGSFGIRQPDETAEEVTPDVLFVPLLAFTPEGQRLGQGGGFYDRYCAAHPGVPAIGLAWDMQVVDSLPTEDHDMPLTAIVTPTRIYGTFA